CARGPPLLLDYGSNYFDFW
nr:immunoglobulin heavy chain junction region [Macaca mulatta]MOV39338.1 immunoglobulin heavy chain junction region [Macaca mulatta]